jgi:hypothetical protein
MNKTGTPANFTSPEKVKLAKEGKATKLTLRQNLAISEYIRTGKKSAAFRAAYKVGTIKKGKNAGKTDAGIRAYSFFRKPKIQDALAKALKTSRFDDQFAVETLKKIVDAGMENIDITRPDTSLKALETYFKLTNKLGGGTGTNSPQNTESTARRMDTTELQQALKELDKKQKRILAIIGTAKEGEIIK